MSAIANLTIADGQATPVNHTFVVKGLTGNRATWADKSGGIPAGYPTFEYEVREAKSKDGAHAVLITVVLPTLESVDGVMKKTRTSSGSIRLNFSQESTEAERLNLMAYLYAGFGVDFYDDILSISPKF